MIPNLFVIANVKQLRTGGSFRILLSFFRTSWGVGFLNSAIFNSFHNRVQFGKILEGFQNFLGGGVWTLQPPLGTPLLSRQWNWKDSERRGYVLWFWCFINETNDWGTSQWRQGALKGCRAVRKKHPLSPSIINAQLSWNDISTTFARASISFVMSVCPSVRALSARHPQDGFPWNLKLDTSFKICPETPPPNFCKTGQKRFFIP